MEIQDSSLKSIIENLPKTAGVYLFFATPKPGEGGLVTPIYIGKAINIKDRVKNHFQQSSYRDNLYIHKVTKIDFINTDSEIEALVLEAQLIKKHQPRFNVVWKDDKNYFFVAIANNKDKIPFVFITHQPRKILDPRPHTLTHKYIGPFVEGDALKKTLKFLRRVFPFYTTNKHPKTACTWCHLDLCPGVTPNLIEYKKNLKKLILILQGKRKTVLYALRREMEMASVINKFEEAGKIRDKIQALERILEHTHVIENSTNQDDRIKSQNSLKEVLGVKKAIKKIECYDISNIQGKNAVGSMVVFVDGVPDKSQYKKFKIKMKNEPNDIAMLNEVLTRRLAHPEWGYPEVMLIDGGKAQLNVAIKAKNSLCLKNRGRENTDIRKIQTIKIISIAKGKQELFIEGQKTPIPLKDLPQEIYNLVKHLDDEAHRFAITYHKKLRKGAMGLTK